MANRTIFLALIYMSLPVFLSLTDPAKLPLPLLVVPFLLLFVIFFVTIRLAVKRLNRRKRLLVAAAGASLPVLLLVFQSIHQLTVKDVLIVLVLISVTMFYLSRADFIH